MIVAMPDRGNRTYWANIPAGPRWADYLAYDNDPIWLVQNRWQTGELYRWTLRNPVAGMPQSSSAHHCNLH